MSIERLFVVIRKFTRRFCSRFDLFCLLFEWLTKVKSPNKRSSYIRILLVIRVKGEISVLVITIPSPISFVVGTLLQQTSRKLLKQWMTTSGLKLSDRPGKAKYYYVSRHFTQIPFYRILRKKVSGHKVTSSLFISPYIVILDHRNYRSSRLVSKL